MTKSILSLLVILLSSLTVISQVTTTGEMVRLPAKDSRSHWLAGSLRNRNQIMKKWFGSKPIGSSTRERPESSPFYLLHSAHQFKGCIDPSEPFQCPQSERCIALQFICDGHAGDCPGNLDENEETCTAVKRPAKENIEKFLVAEYTLHGSDLFIFLFGEKLSKSIKENNAFWLDTIASAFSVAKTIRSFAEKTQMSADDLAHFQNVMQTIHDGRLEDIPLFAQEAVNQGLAALIEKLYESGFMEQ